MDDRLDSWKEIAAHLKRGVSTVQRWEKQEGLPVHRHLHNKLGSVWAHRSEIDAWWRERQGQLERQPEPSTPPWVRFRWAAVAMGAAVLVAGILWAVHNRLRPEATTPRPVPMTSLEGREFDPSFSPDGHELAFVWDGDRGAELALYVLRIGAGAPRRLTDAPGSVCCPAWSPDGRSLAFVRQSGDEGSIVMIPAAGGAERNLVPVRPWFGTALAWSPDGKSLAYPDRRSPNDPYSLVVLSLDTLESRRATHPGVSNLGDAFPSYADDGSLAFARVSASGDSLPSDVYVLRDGDGEPTRLTAQGGLIGGLDWAPGAREVIYAAVLKGETPRLWRVSARPPANPTVIEGLVPSETVAESPSAVSHALRVSIARNRGQIAYVRRSYDTNIWSLAHPLHDQASPHRLIASTQPDDSPQYSPDGRRIAFSSSRSWPPEIWTCARDGTGCAPLTHLGVHSGTPRWSPDGRRIAFDSRPAGQSDIYLVEVESGQTTKVTSSPADDVVPSWSRDGRLLYFASNRGGAWQVYRTTLDGGEPSPVSTHGGFVAFEGEDAVYFTKYDEPGLWRRPKSGGAESKVLDGPRCWGHWALAPDGVYLLEARPGAGTSLDLFDFAQGRTTSLRAMPLAAPCAESSLAVSPDGRELLYVAVEEGSDIMTVPLP
jgi:Tol biopolymer transport system component